VITIFGTTYFTIGAGLVVLVLAAPLLFWFSRWLWRPNVEGKPLRVRWLAIGGTTLGLLLLTAVGLFWDVYLIGQRAKELCRETGLVVYRQASADGFAGSAAIEQWAKHGFTFVETDHFGTKYRYEMADGGPKTTRIASLQAMHLVSLVDSPVAYRNGLTEERIKRRGAIIRELTTDEPIAELTKFTVYYGWADTALINLFGFVANPRTCGRDRNGEVRYSETVLGIEDLVLATLKPNVAPDSSSSRGAQRRSDP
jgi:hypothetical protein